MRPPNWFVDINALRDDEGVLYEVGRRGRLATFTRRIIEAATIQPGGGVVTPSALPCRRRPRHRVCPGHIRLSHTDIPPVVEWECSDCPDSGTISGWHGSPWDLRAYRDHRGDLTSPVIFFISAEEHRFLLDCDSLDIDEPALASSATWRRGRVELKGSLQEFESAHATICEELDLMRKRRMRSVLRGLAMRLQQALAASPS